jgi:hypothetical protein
MSTEASIGYYLDIIKNATRGSDVRDAIVKAISKCYEDGKTGATDLDARTRIDTLESKLGDVDISTLGSTLTEAVVAAEKNQYYKIGDVVSIDHHDWFPGFFNDAEGGTAIFRVPFSKLAPVEIPSNTAEKDGKPYITGVFRYVDQLRTVGVNGWQTIPISSVVLSRCEITHNRSGMLVTLTNTSLLQPKRDVCLISCGIDFTFTDGT